MSERRQDNLKDHDLLVRLDEKVENLTTKLEEHFSNNADRVNDHETRIRRLELWGAMAIGAIALIQFVGFGYLITLTHVK